MFYPKKNYSRSFESSVKKKKKRKKKKKSEWYCKITLALLSHPSGNDAFVQQLLTLPKVKILFTGFNNKIHRLNNYL